VIILSRAVTPPCALCIEPTVSTPARKSCGRAKPSVPPPNSMALSETGILTDEELQKIYVWIDSIPLSRPKRNIARDFSDGG